MNLQVSGFWFLVSGLEIRIPHSAIGILLIS